MSKVITVKFKEQQGAEDLYRNVETRRVYARQPANVNDIVFWYTTCKWTGGYETDCPIRDGTIMRVVDARNNVLFEECLRADNWNGGTSAKKVGLFSYEEYQCLANQFAQRLALRPYVDWIGCNLDDMERCGYKGYEENWLYWEVESKGAEVLGKVNILGYDVRVVKESVVHKISGKEWEEVTVHSKDNICLGICGYIWKENARA